MTEPTYARPGAKPSLDGDAVIAALQAGEPIKSIASRLNVHISTVYRTRDRAILAAFLSIPRAR